MRWRCRKQCADGPAVGPGRGNYGTSHTCEEAPRRNQVLIIGGCAKIL